VNEDPVVFSCLSKSFVLVHYLIPIAVMAITMLMNTTITMATMIITMVTTITMETTITMMTMTITITMVTAPAAKRKTTVSPIAKVVATTRIVKSSLPVQTKN
jgi:hypothetical protein